MKIKKILVIIICLAVLFVPTYIAVASYKQAQKSPITDTSVTEMKIVDPNGTVYDISDTEEIKYFVSLTENGKAMTEMPEEMKNVSPCTVTFKCTNGIDYEFKYYFTQNPEECILVDYKNKVSRLPSDDVLQFLNDSKSGYLYEGSAQPLLSVSGNDILPDSMTWSYLTYGDNKIDVVCKTSSEKNSITTTKGFELSYTVEPDVVNVIINENGVEVYNGLYDNIGSYQFIENSNLSVKVNAQWNEDTLSRRSSGTAEYLFDLSVLPAPIFTLAKDTITQGEFVAITCENVINPSEIQFSSLPGIDYTPTFTDVGGYCVALIPISYDTPYSESYEFTLTYGDTTKKLNLNVNEKSYKTVNLPTSASTLNSYRTSTTLNEYNEILNNYLKVSSTSKYFDGYFGEGTSKPLTILMGFGLHVALETGDSYRNDGVDFGFAGETDTAAAVNSGVVVYTGKLSYSGNTVIVDHGLGLMSTYCNLDSISVSVGQNLSRGDVIGVIGTTGCTDISRLHVGLYVYGVPVQSYTLWNDGDDKEVKIYVPRTEANTNSDDTSVSE